MPELFLKLLPLSLVLWMALVALPAEAKWKINTETTQLEFTFENGIPALSELSAIGEPSRHNWTLTAPETALPALLEVDGKSQKLEWKYVETIARKSSVSFIYRSDNPKLELTSTWSTVSGSGPVEHAVAIRNQSGQDVRLAPPPTISLVLRAPQMVRNELTWVEKGAGYTRETGGVHTEALIPENLPDKEQADFVRILHSGPYSSDDENRDAIPWFTLRNSAARLGIYGGIEFSGWTEIAVNQKMKEHQAPIRIAMGLQPREGKTRCRIAAGESLQLPTCFIGAFQGSVDDGCNQLHRWVENHLRPPIPGGVTPVLVNNSWGSGMAIDESLAKRMIDDCVKLGMELFHVDAGWYVNVGNWHSNPEKYPGGLETIADLAHASKLKFGLWVGWTQGGSDRNAGPGVLSVFNPEMKNWFGQDCPEDWKNWEFTGMPVCLGSADARKWCLNDLRRMVKHYKLDLLEHDQIMIVDACSRKDHDHLPDDPVDVSRAAAEGYYAVYDQLRKENPDLLFEDCVNGGRMVDFGVAKRVHYMCVTDTYDPLTCRRAFYDNSYPFPPSMVELYLANVPGDTISSFKSMLRSAMLGWATIMIDTSQWTPEQHDAAKKEFKIYKTRLRPFIARGNFYHSGKRPTGKTWESYTYLNPKTGAQLFYIFRAQAPEETMRFSFDADPSKKYQIESIDNSTPSRICTGAELADSGFTVRLEKEASDLIFLSEVK